MSRANRAETHGGTRGPLPRARGVLALAVPGLLVLGLLVPGLGGSGCGGGPQEGVKNWVDKPAAPPKDKKLIKSEAAVEEEEVHTNPRWDLIETHFKRFARRPATAQKDIFKSHLDEYVEKFEVPLTDATAEEDGEPPPIETAEELNPLKKFPADEYKLVAVMTGIGTPAALVRDPKGNAFTVRVDTEVGNEGGVVETITQYELVVTNPGEPKPVRLSIEPRMFEISQRQLEERELQEEVPEELP